MSQQPKGEDFEHWYRREYPRVVGTLTLLLRDHEAALDSSAEAFAKAYERWNRVSRMRNPAGWVFVVAINDAKRRYRRNRKDRMLPGSIEPTFQPEVELDLWAAIGRLPKRQQQAVLLRYVFGLLEREIADNMRVTVGTVSRQLHLARHRLSEDLTEPSKLGYTND